MYIAAMYVNGEPAYRRSSCYSFQNILRLFEGVEKTWTNRNRPSTFRMWTGKLFLLRAI